MSEKRKEEKLKEIKIKEKWLYEAMDRAMEKKDGFTVAMKVLAESMNEVNKVEIDLWCEMEKLYKLDPKKRYEYFKRTHSIKDICTKNAEPAWMRNKRLDKK
ncbi:MAG TPA: hypothetical protein ENI23_16100 [bacterium]|nr:hypothetical protein [bacterium]